MHVALSHAADERSKVCAFTFTNMRAEAEDPLLWVPSGASAAADLTPENYEQEGSVFAGISSRAAPSQRHTRVGGVAWRDGSPSLRTEACGPAPPDQNSPATCMWMYT